MVFYCLSEAGYETSNWYQQIVNGLLNEKRSKRFTVILSGSMEEIEAFPVTGEDVLLVIGSDANWLGSVIAVFEKQFGNRIVVLGNCQRRPGKRYSIVASDVSRDVRRLYHYLTSYQKTAIAMYGINPHSASDGFRRKSFLDCGAGEEDVYCNRGDLKQCFAAFREQHSRYDGVICANDYSAISLLRHLKEEGLPVPFIVSCGETRLARAFSPGITNLKTNYTEFGKAGVQVAKMLHKNPGINSIDCYLTGDIVPGETTDNLPVPPEAPMPPVIKTDLEDTFYADPEVAEMLKMEKLLRACDRTEKEILSCLARGMTYFEVAEQFHLSEGGVKYKIKRLFDLCGITLKAEFLDLAEKYLFLPPPQ